MSTGKVKFFNVSKGYGFIIEDGNEAEHFVHSTGLIDQINEGDSVEFELVDGKKGKIAGNVKRISLLIFNSIFQDFPSKISI